ncbi:hypothetical protein ACQP2C_12035 [Micromonospora zamorensis]|uniref:hypothetical protein n=1 Tax=Micromonospora zamorensis TaxID=709883 RepID=UPI003D96D205
MELGCSTIGFSNLPLKEAVRCISAQRFTDIEIGMWSHGCPHLDLDAPTADTVAGCRELLDRHGMRVGALNSAPWVYCADRWDGGQLRAAADRLLALAGGLGCALIVNLNELDDVDDALTREALFVRGVFRRGRDVYGVPVTVEAPHRGLTAATVGETLQHRGKDIHDTPGDRDYDWDSLLRFLMQRPRPVYVDEFDGRLAPGEVAQEFARARDRMGQRWAGLQQTSGA